jgi:hypothetical protein
MDTRVKNLIGLRFGRLVVVSFADSIRGDARWKCKCDCGQESTVFAQNFKSFAEFLSCIGRKPENKTDLDRINNDGHYEPGNVRWATRSENCRNYTITPELSMIRAANMRKAQKLRWANHGL